MRSSTYLVFGDLHGRILPAFRLAIAYARASGVRLDGLLQVGDLGYFPDWSRADKATRRHAEKDPLEMGVLEVAAPSRAADAVFADEHCPETLWFIAGNHEDYDALDACARAAGPRAESFPVDAYCKVRCIRDGRVVALPDGPRVGGLWGVDRDGVNARRRLPERAYVRWRSSTELGCSSFDVLLIHDAPRDAVYPGAGSSESAAVIRAAQPRFAFFGHYSGHRGEAEGDFGTTRVFHLAGFELRDRGRAEAGSVGVLTWQGDSGAFHYLDPHWLASFTR